MSELEKRRITKNTTARQDYKILDKAINDYLFNNCTYFKDSQKLFQRASKAKNRLEIKYNFVFETELYSKFCIEFANKFLKEAA